MFIQASGYEKNIPYQISTTITYGHKKELYDALDKMQGVNKYYIDTDGYEHFPRQVRARLLRITKLKIWQIIHLIIQSWSAEKSMFLQ